MEQTLSQFFLSAPYIVSLIAGILTFFSPCVLPLIPAYISYISGLSIKELGHVEELSLEARKKIIKASIMFVTGFGIIFVILGVIMAQLIEDVLAYEWVTWIAGGIVIIFGLQMMGLFRIGLLNLERRAQFGDARHANENLWAPFVLGVSFALGWTPCIGPIFTAIVSMAAQDTSHSVILMFIYASGLGVPFVLTALLTSRAFKFFNRIKAHFRLIEIGAGSLLVLVGIAIATGGLGQMATFLTVG